MEACDDRISIQVYIINKEQAAAAIIRMEGQPQQSLLGMLAVDFSNNIQKWCGHQLAIFQDKNTAALLHNEQPPGPVAGILDIHRQIQPGEDRDPIKASRVWKTG